MAGRDDNTADGKESSSSISFGKVELTAGSIEPAGRVDPESPFRILVWCSTCFACSGWSEFQQQHGLVARVGRGHHYRAGW